MHHAFRIPFALEAQVWGPPKLVQGAVTLKQDIIKTYKDIVFEGLDNMSLICLGLQQLHSEMH